MQPKQIETPNQTQSVLVMRLSSKFNQAKVELKIKLFGPSTKLENWNFELEHNPTMYIVVRISVGTSSGSSSFTALFYIGSLKVSKAWARLGHKIAKLGKARAQNVRNEFDLSQNH